MFSNRDRKILSPLFSLFGPMPLFLIEKYLPHPSFAEEIFKLLIIIILLKAGKRNLVFIAVLCGVFFTLSESIFYLANILMVKNPQLFFERIFFTGILHVFTFSFLYLMGRRGRAGLIIGFLFNVLIHFSYNYWVLNYFHS